MHHLLATVLLLLVAALAVQAMYHETTYQEILSLEEEHAHRARSIYGKHVVCGADIIDAIYFICDCMLFPKDVEVTKKAFVDCCEGGCSRRRLSHLFCC